MAREIPFSDKRLIVPDRLTGRELKEAAGVDPARILTVWRPDRVEVVKDEDVVDLTTPDLYFEDVPNWRYGRWWAGVRSPRAGGACR